MTPIKVRGKRSRKQDLKLSDSSPPVSSSKLSSSLPPSRRPTKHYTSMSDSISVFRRSRTTANERSPLRALASLERLPIELLEIIFFQCLNVNLPQASLTLAAALSSFHVKARLLTKVFSSYGSLETRCKKSLLHDNELRGLVGGLPEVAKLQSNILKSRWFTLDFLQQCIPIYLQNTILRNCKTLRLVSANGVAGEVLTKATFAHWMRSASEQHHMDDPGGLSGDISGYVYSKYTKFPVLMVVGSRDGSICLRGSGILTSYTLLHCLDGCWLPEKLLRGPWTEAKCEFLMLLLRSGAKIDWIDSTAGEVAELGLQDAIQERNAKAVEILIAKYKLLPIELYDGDPTCGHVSGSLRAVDPVVSVGINPTTEHLRKATAKHNCQLEILALIDADGNLTRNNFDPVLVTWALARKIEGDKRGQWLLDRMKNEHHASFY